jgi:phospholipase C
MPDSSRRRRRTAAAVTLAMTGALALAGGGAALASGSASSSTQGRSRPSGHKPAGRHHRHRGSSLRRGHARGPRGHGDGGTATPIKHVIVIIGENHTFDNVFATYRAPYGQQVRNLLSEGIVNAAGGAGPAVSQAQQNTASDTTADGYRVTPQRTGTYATLPQPNTTYVSKACSGQDGNVPDARFPASLANARQGCVRLPEHPVLCDLPQR